MFPKTAMAELRNATPELAIGLGVATGDGAPQILCEGPLWRGASQQVGEDARWHIGSITKSLTATLVMQQVDGGRLDLDRPIGDYLAHIEDMDAGWRAVTLAQLLSHTAGMASNPPFWLFIKWDELGFVQGRQQVLHSLWDRAPKSPAGGHLYSNLGYMLIGYLLEDLLGQPWEEIVQQQIAAPLGLRSLGFGAPRGGDDPKGHRSRFFRLHAVDRDSVAADNPRWLGPAGTVHMSINDLLTYGRAHLRALRGEGSDFLSQQSSARMQTPIKNDYGFGWVIQDNVVWHNGSNTMWYALLMLDPVSDSVVVATQNAMVQTQRIDALLRDTVRALRDA